VNECSLCFVACMNLSCASRYLNGPRASDSNTVMAMQFVGCGTFGPKWLLCKLIGKILPHWAKV
jgi:hypothetical protein